MDKTLIGKWYREEDGETINIFDEIPLRMKMSFSSSGYYNFEPNCVYEDGDDLCYEINDDTYRMVYHVHHDVENDQIVGYYTQFGKEHPVKYARISTEPEDAPYYYHPTKIYVPGTDEKRIDVLKRYCEYANDEEFSYRDEWVLGGELPLLLMKYGYFDYVKPNECVTDTTVFRLLDFVCDHFGHNGSGGVGNGRQIEDLISFCEAHENKTNCRGLAILLASLLRLNGIKARHITCLPFEDPFDDCHVVVDCQLPSGKRVMLDPTMHLYYRDTEGEFVSLPRLREMLLMDETLVPNPDASYNGGDFDADDNRDYMTKNTVRFARCTLHKNGVDHSTVEHPYITLIPKEYPVEQFNQTERKNFVRNAEAFWGLQ